MSSGLDPGTAPPRAFDARLRLFLWRSLWLRCPECGVSPLFARLRDVRSTDGWLTPLPGCAGCGYAYEREPGYFLAATWIVQAFVVLGLGTAWGVFAEWYWSPAMPVLLLITLVPALLLGVLFARHAKAIYLAVEHAVDPHRTPSKR